MPVRVVVLTESKITCSARKKLVVVGGKMPPSPPVLCDHVAAEVAHRLSICFSPKQVNLGDTGEF